MRGARSTWLLSASSLLLAARHAFAQGCAMCGNSFAPDDPTTRAFNTSVGFLLLAPYLLVAGVAGWFYFRHRRAGSSRRSIVVPLPWVRGVSAATPEED